jgi:hypothetical protein
MTLVLSKATGLPAGSSLLLGAVLFLFNASSFPSWVFRDFCQQNKVGLETLNASFVAAVPYFSQNANILHLSFAVSLIIYLKRITRSQVLMNPFVPLNLLKMRI